MSITVGNSSPGQSTSSALRYLKTLMAETSATGAAVLIEDQVAGAGPMWLSHGSLDRLPAFSSPDAALAAVKSLSAGAEPANAGPINYFSDSNALSCTLCVSASSAENARHAEAERVERRASARRKSAKPEQQVWIALSFDSAEAQDALQRASEADAHQPCDADGWLARSLLLHAAILWDSSHYGQLLRDPTSRLPGRAEFQSQLNDAFQRAARSGEPLGLLLLNPDGFGAINERLGREQGDRAVAEIAQLLRGSLRTDEQIFRYGGAVFAVLMPASSADAVATVAGKLRESMSGAYLDGAVRLTFSIGAAVYASDSGDDACLDELVLLRRADHALNLAKRAGGAVANREG